MPGRTNAPRPFKIGRAPESDIVLADASVSRQHAELVVATNGQVVLSDCKSTHGTEIVERGVGRRIAQETVRPDATIRFGDVTITVAELLDALRARYPEIQFPRDGVAPKSEPKAAPKPEPKSRSRPWSKGNRLVRCACGTIKPKGQRCPECGE